MPDNAARELNIDIRRVLFRFSLPQDLYQFFLETIVNHHNSLYTDTMKDNNINPHWMLHNHNKDEQGKFLIKTNNGECTIEVLVRPTGQGEFRDFIKDLAHQQGIGYKDQT